MSGRDALDREFEVAIEENGEIKKWREPPVAHEQIQAFNDYDLGRAVNPDGIGSRVFLRVIERGEGPALRLPQARKIGAQGGIIEGMPRTAAPQALGVEPSMRDVVAIHRDDRRVRQVIE